MDDDDDRLTRDMSRFDRRTWVRVVVVVVVVLLSVGVAAGSFRAAGGHADRAAVFADAADEGYSHLRSVIESVAWNLEFIRRSGTSSDPAAGYPFSLSVAGLCHGECFVGEVGDDRDPLPATQRERFALAARERRARFSDLPAGERARANRALQPLDEWDDSIIAMLDDAGLELVDEEAFDALDAERLDEAMVPVVKRMRDRWENLSRRSRTNELRFIVLGVAAAAVAAVMAGLAFGDVHDWRRSRRRQRASVRALRRLDGRR